MDEPRTERANEMALIALVTRVHEDVKALNAALTTHIKDEPEALKAHIDKVLILAFPEGDVYGHRVAHEAQIRAVLAKAEFWKMLRDKLAGAGLLGLSGLLLSMLWIGFQANLHKGN